MASAAQGHGGTRVGVAWDGDRGGCGKACLCMGVEAVAMRRRGGTEW